MIIHFHRDFKDYYPEKTNVANVSRLAEGWPLLLRWWLEVGSAWKDSLVKHKSTCLSDQHFLIQWGIVVRKGMQGSGSRDFRADAIAIKF